MSDLSTPMRRRTDDNRELMEGSVYLEAPQHVSPARAITLLWRSKWLVLFIIVLVAVPAGAVILNLRQYYDAAALVMVDTRKTEFSDLQAMATSVTGDALTVRTQTDILMSPAIAERVVDRLDLVHVAPVQTLLRAGPTWPHRIESAVLGWLGYAPPPARVLTAADERQVATQWLRDRMTIANDGRSYTVAITARTPNAQLSADIANAYADLYLDFMKDLKIQALARANAWLDHQIAPLQERMRQAEQAVETYRERNGLVLNHTMDGDTGPAAGQASGSTIADQQLDQVNAQLIVARGDLAEKQSHLRQAESAIEDGRGLDAVPEVLASPLIQQLREQQAEVAGRSASLEQSDLGDNPALRSVHAASADLARRISAETDKLLVSLRAQTAAAQEHVDSLNQSLARLRGEVVGEKQAEVSLRQLVSEAEAARSVYRDYLGRYEQTSSQAALQEPEADLISRAEPPLSPTGPPRLRLMALAGLAGMLIGGIIALLIDRQRGGLRTAEQLEAATGLFPLGFVPRVRRGERGRIESQDTAYTRAVDHVRSLLRFGDMRYRAHVVLITSAAIAEGKSFFALSLAASIGREGGRALLIDMDVRRSGFADVTANRRGKRHAAEHPVANAGVRQLASITEDALPGVNIMRLVGANAGIMPPGWAADLGELIKDATAQYDLIVIDTPPVLALPDAAIMAKLVDGAIMVVRWRHTPVAAVTSALRTLNAYGVRLLGGVLTQVQLAEMGAAEGAHAHFHHRTARAYG